MSVREFPLLLVLGGFLTGCSPSAPFAAGGGSGETAGSSADNTNTTDANAADDTSHDVTPANPSPSQPVTAAIEVRPRKIAPGGTAEVVVHLRIAPGHRVNADDPSGTFAPLSVDLEVPEGIEPVGEWKFPTAERGHAGALEYRKSVILRRHIRISAGRAPCELPIAGSLHVQVCNDELCWPAATISLNTSISIQP